MTNGKESHLFLVRGRS